MPYWAEAAGTDLRFGVAGVSRGTVAVGFQLGRLALWQRPFKFLSRVRSGCLLGRGRFFPHAALVQWACLSSGQWPCNQMKLGVPHIRAMAMHLAWDSRQLAVAVQAAFLRTIRCLLTQRDWRACALVSAALVSAGDLHVFGTWASGSRSQAVAFWTR